MAYDVIVFGSGPGVIPAIRASQLNQKVAIIRKRKPWGIMHLNWGCTHQSPPEKCPGFEYDKHAADYGINKLTT